MIDEIGPTRVWRSSWARHGLNAQRVLGHIRSRLFLNSLGISQVGLRVISCKNLSAQQGIGASNQMSCRDCCHGQHQGYLSSNCGCICIASTMALIAVEQALSRDEYHLLDVGARLCVVRFCGAIPLRRSGTQHE
jgi:hypothetical protein